MIVGSGDDGVVVVEKATIIVGSRPFGFLTAWIVPSLSPCMDNSPSYMLMADYDVFEYWSRYELEVLWVLVIKKA